MMNYDALATVVGDCYPALEGCLNPRALNFGCTTYDSQSPCQGLPPSQTPQIHKRLLCHFAGATAPPNPPPIPVSPGLAAVVVPVVRSTMVAAGVVEDYDSLTKERLVRVYTEAAGVDETAGSVTVTPASVLIEVTIEMASAEAAEAAASAISIVIGDSPESASLALGIVVESAPRTAAGTIVRMIDDDGQGDGVTIGVVIGLAVVLPMVALVLATILWRKRASAAVADSSQDMAMQDGRSDNDSRKKAWADDDND